MSDYESLRGQVEKGAELTNRYLRAGPGSAGARQYLDEAIGVLEKAYQRVDPGEELRGQVAAQLGWLYGMRHLLHGGDPRDRTTGIHLLDESLGFPGQSPVLSGGSRLVLGQLLMAGATAMMTSPGALLPGRPAGDARDIDRAIALFREVADGPPVSAELTSSARTLVEVAELLRGLVGGSGGMDFGRLAQMVTAMQRLQEQMRGRGMTPPPMPDIPAFVPAPRKPPETPATPAPPGTPAASGPPGTPADPDQAGEPTAQPARPGRPFDERDRPDIPFDPGRVAVVDGPIPAGGPVPRPQPDPIPATPAAELRTLMRTGSPTVDEQVALAAATVEAPGSRPADRLTLAVALIARHHHDGAEPPDGLGDLDAAARCLERIAADLPGMPAEQVERALGIAADLPGAAPLEAAFAEVAAAMRDAGLKALVYPSRALTAAGTWEPVVPGADWTGRVAATTPITGDATVSQVRTAAQLLTLIRRGRRPIAEAAVFVANPRADRESATVDVLRLRRAFYPRSTGLGHTIEQNHGEATPAQVMAHLNASVLHLGCGVTVEGALELADGTILTPATIAVSASPGPGGVAILPPTPAALGALAEALLTGGFTSVIGFTAAVDDRVASLVYWMLHTALVDDGLEPAEAVAAVRSWLRDPRRKPPELLAAEYRGIDAAVDLSDPACAGVLVCHGC
ncbi:hypothetical protein Q0Z83_045400 [Actinoplanes sichuanensis]|uniref:CHAT domain-containing protein n=1 Tax=Actinoplanes sichuanensis TaxID=512349 RepID=A0ABW4AAK0_9ACTN|nr:hypothetical protein [Actinoplanes sichuanensis]BEL06349.1 hypothetical protein Q0Z83_045400 [Actinoplanes sichuanensis]